MELTNWIDWEKLDNSDKKDIKWVIFDVSQSVYSQVSTNNRALEYYQKKLKICLENLENNLDFKEYIDYLYILWNSEDLKINTSFYRKKLWEIQDKIFENKINYLISKYKNDKKFIELMNYILEKAKENKIDISNSKEKLEEIYQTEIDFLTEDYKKWKIDIKDIIHFLDFTKKVWLNLKNIKEIGFLSIYKEVLELELYKPIKPELKIIEPETEYRRHRNNFRPQSQKSLEIEFKYSMEIYDEKLEVYEKNINFLKKIDKNTIEKIIKWKQQIIIKTEDKDELIKLDNFIDKLDKAKMIEEDVLEDFTTIKEKFLEKEQQKKQEEEQKIVEEIHNEIKRIEELWAEEYEKEINKLLVNYWNSKHKLHKMLRVLEGLWNTRLKNLWHNKLSERIKKIQTDINRKKISNSLLKIEKKLDKWIIFDCEKEFEEIDYDDFMMWISGFSFAMNEIHYNKIKLLKIKQHLLIIKELLKNKPKFKINVEKDLENSYKNFIETLEEEKKEWLDISIFEKEIGYLEKQVVSKLLKKKYRTFTNTKNRYNAIKLLNITLKAKLLGIQIPFKEENIRSYVDKIDKYDWDETLKIKWKKIKESRYKEEEIEMRWSWDILTQEEIDALMNICDKTYEEDLDLY